MAFLIAPGACSGSTLFHGPDGVVPAAGPLATGAGPVPGVAPSGGGRCPLEVAGARHLGFHGLPALAAVPLTLFALAAATLACFCRHRRLPFFGSLLGIS